ncbi:HAD hydrolase-like protein [Aliiroseovarius sp. S2029]|uniref:HAD hydrolase-like protein n=1 Tax=Aliiroseovarius sp. S2029 TaxID=2936988 RepID=UPI0020BE741E|nr:HAD hydrolase-like protein [Aliiroseovarius sp. S2029]MCK8483489.1 HAD hydrolase-like protein [Aliiroseovarius sp. S2029]
MGTVFWDLDGTLTDPKPGITGSVVKALQDLGLDAPAPDDLEWVIGPALLWSFEKLGTPDPAQALALYRRYYEDHGGMYDCTVFDGIPAALTAIGARHVMHLATAKPHVYARKITAHFGLAKHMTHEFGPELDGTRNDKGELLAHALTRTGDDPARCVMVGDRHHDLDAARAVGMRFIAVGWGYGGGDDLSGADAQVKTPDELPGVVDRFLP